MAWLKEAEEEMMSVGTLPQSILENKDLGIVHDLVGKEVRVPYQELQAYMIYIKNKLETGTYSWDPSEGSMYAGDSGFDDDSRRQGMHLDLAWSGIHYVNQTYGKNLPEDDELAAYELEDVIRSLIAVFVEDVLRGEQ